MKKNLAKHILQRYGKGILTVMSILLMFIFALPTFRNKTAEDAQQMAVGDLNGKKVTNDDIAGARGELSVINNLQLFYSSRFNLTATVLQSLVPDESEQPQFWYLLRVEAGKYSATVFSDADAVEFMNSFGIANDELDSKLRALSVSRRGLAAVLSHLDTIENYLRFVLRQPRPVTAFELVADRDLRKIQVQFAAVNAAQDWPQAPAPAVAELQAQFDAYKKTIATHISAPPAAPYLVGIELDPAGGIDNPYRAIVGFPDAVDKALRVRVGDTLPWDGSKVTRILKANPYINTPDAIVLSDGGRAVPAPVFPGQNLQQQPLPAQPAEVNGRRFPFGYKYPDRVTVQYLVFNRDQIRKTFTVTDTIANRAFEAYLALKAQAPASAPATAPATAPESQPAGLAVAPPTSQPATAAAVRSWDSMKDELVRKEVDKEVDKLLKKMLEWVRNRTETPFRNTDWKDNPPPAQKDWVDYAKLAEDFAKIGDHNKYQPVVKDTGSKVLSAGQLQAVPGIGNALYTNTQGQIFPFSMLATNVGELVTLEKTAPLARFNLHVGTEGPEVTDKDGNVYFFRVTSSDKAHEPASLDEDKPGVSDPAIRQQVTEDCRKLATFTRRVKEVKDVLTRSDNGGVVGVASQFKVEVQRPVDFNRIDAQAPFEIQGIRDFVKTAFTLRDPRTPAAAKVLESDAIFKCFPMELLHDSPATALDFGNSRNNIFSQPDPATGAFLRSYLDIEALAARLKYVPVGGWPKRNR